MFEHCERVIEALRNAPVKAEGKDAQEISRPAPSEPDTSRTTKPAETKRELYERMMNGEDPEGMGCDLEQLGWDNGHPDGDQEGYPARF